MAYRNPALDYTPTTQTVVPTAYLTTLSSDVQFFADPPRVKVTKSSDQTLSNNTRTAVTWDTETWDTDTIHSTSANTDRFTCVTAGRYLIVARVTMAVDGGAAGYRALELWKNGDGTTWVDGDTRTSPGSATYPTLHITAEVSLAASDYVSLIAFQNSGGNLAIRSGTGSWSSWFSARYISS